MTGKYEVSRKLEYLSNPPIYCQVGNIPDIATKRCLDAILNLERDYILWNKSSEKENPDIVIEQKKTLSESADGIPVVAADKFLSRLIRDASDFEESEEREEIESMENNEQVATSNTTIFAAAMAKATEIGKKMRNKEIKMHPEEEKRSDAFMNEIMKNLKKEGKNKK